MARTVGLRRSEGGTLVTRRWPTGGNVNVRSGYAAPGIDSTPPAWLGRGKALTPEDAAEVERLLWIESGGDPDYGPDDPNDPAWGPPPPLSEVASREADRMHREYPAGT